MFSSFMRFITFFITKFNIFVHYLYKIDVWGWLRKSHETDTKAELYPVASFPRFRKKSSTVLCLYSSHRMFTSNRSTSSSSDGNALYCKKIMVIIEYINLVSDYFPSPTPLSSLSAWLSHPHSIPAPFLPILSTLSIMNSVVPYSASPHPSLSLHLSFNPYLSPALFPPSPYSIAYLFPFCFHYRNRWSSLWTEGFILLSYTLLY